MHSQLNFLTLWLPVIYSDSFSWNHFSLDIIIWKGVFKFSSFCRALSFSCQESTTSPGLWPLWAEVGGEWTQSSLTGESNDFCALRCFLSIQLWLMCPVLSKAFIVIYNDPGKWAVWFTLFYRWGVRSSESEEERREGRRAKKKEDLISTYFWRYFSNARSNLSPPNNHRKEELWAHFTAEKMRLWEVK